MVQGSANQVNTLKALALCGIIAPILFTILVVIAGLFYQGYNHATYAISELGGVTARYPLIQNANFFILGILVMAFSVGLHRGIGGQGSKLGTVLFAIFGLITAFAQPFLPLDPGGEFVTLTGTLHNVTGLGSFLFAVVGIFVTSRRLRHDPGWQSYRKFSIVSSMVALVSLVAWIGIAKGAEIGAVNGVLQRVFVGVILLWIEVMALHLLKRSHYS
ncbi:MAG: DUF998 domain-containing protein [Chloroflexi bacterium]|nr:DUF998 domain-containing protein [Chloroflexota bacterium]